MNVLTIVNNNGGGFSLDLSERITALGYGREADILEQKNIEAKDHSAIPYSTQTDLHKFCVLAETWKEETKHFSMMNQIALNPSYQQVIGMGIKAVSFILEDLRLAPAHWFWALKAITGTDPVKSANRGDIKKMANDWIEWGLQNGYIS